MSLDIDSGAWALISLGHFASTWFLVGLIWMIQVVHYPSFSAIDPVGYQSFQQRHMEKMGRLIALPWLIEGLSVLALFAWAPTTPIRILATIGGLLEVAVIAVTVFSSIPAHQALSDGFDEAAHRRLVQTNWLRTLAWTARGTLAIVVLWLTVSPS